MDTTNETTRPLDDHEARVAELIGRYYEGELSEAESAELAETLRDDDAARQQFVSFGMGRSLLNRTMGADRVAGRVDAGVGAAAAAERATVAGRIGALVRSPLVQAAVLAAAVTVFITLIANVEPGATPREAAARDDKAEPTANAVITDVRDAEWLTNDATTEPEIGSQLTDGSITLTGGATQMVFSSGAVVDVLGPAEFQVVGPKRGYLRSGRVLVWVPERAHGFTITTDSGDVIDLGTEFGVHVDAAGTAEVHVIRGRVRAELRGDGAARRTKELAETQAARLDGDARVVEPVAIDAERFGRTIGSHAIEEPDPDHGFLVNFKDIKLRPYGRMKDAWQDGQHGLPTSATVLDSGHTLKLSGNAWKMIERPYTVTKRTVVSFDFRSTSAGQIHGFGFDNDDVFNREVDPQMMQVFGDETLPRINRTYWNYSGAGENAEWKHYVIPVGQLHQGAYRYLYFVADDDVSGKADSYFRNVRIYEAQSVSAIPGAVTPLSVTIGKGTPW